jgi:GDP-mannose 6-dehydrogenase
MSRSAQEGDVMQSISVFGLGYVGAVTAVCMAHKGHRVVGADLNPDKVKMLASGHTPIVEARVEDLAVEGHSNGRLSATVDGMAAVHDTNVSFVCVGTPSQRNGKLSLQAVERVCEDLGRALKLKASYHWVVLRSTVLPGTTDEVVIPTLERTSGKKAGKDFGVCFHPEFLREGTAVADFFEPPFTVFGTADSTHIVTLRELYHWAPGQIYESSTTTAEMVKYVCNAFHALKVGFANEIGAICRELGVDTEVVTEIFTSDVRLNISKAYLKPGFAFGGSCLPKDLRALTYRSKELDLQLPLLESLLPSNTQHIERAIEIVLHAKKRNIGVLGLSFKQGTDDLRESPMVHLVKRLLGEGCICRIYDEDVVLGHVLGSNRQFIEETIPHIGSLLTSNLAETIENSEVLIISTKAVPTETIEKHLKPGTLVLDLVHLDASRRLKSHQPYHGICW